MNNLEEIFNERKNNPLYNTSYPLKKEDWSRYNGLMVDKGMSFLSDDINLYIHIPFCNSICSFCEYSKILTPSVDVQMKYLDILESDIDKFINYLRSCGCTLNKKLLRGFDIGGGTPTSLSNESFERLIEIYKKTINSDVFVISNGFEPSIEGTIGTMSIEKINLLREAGIKRISFGIQSSNKDTCKANNRKNTNVFSTHYLIGELKTYGFKVNLDMMYGLKGQTVESIEQDIKTVVALRPDQITLYELRTNMIHEENHMNSDILSILYDKYFCGLTSKGYKGVYGGNTFSVDFYNDHGMSSYLYNRMYLGENYKGFGISAQSMSEENVSYNKGKTFNAKEIKDIIDNCNTFDGGDEYFLPNNEIANKKIAISAYGGVINLDMLSNVYQCNAELLFHDVIKYVIDNEYMKLVGKDLKVTQKGFRYYGAIFSLFYR